MVKENRSNFEIFKSNVCHRVKDIGDIPFIIENLQSNDIVRYFNKKWYAESLYLLAMVDYLSRENNIPLCTNYDNIRACKLTDILYPLSVTMFADVTKSDKIKEKSWNNSIPEFKRFNIVENEVRNVI